MEVTFPYIQSSKNLIDLSQALRKSMPSKITYDYIKIACGISEVSAQKVFADLKKFGLVSEDGVLTERGRLLRTPEKYNELGTQILQQYYSPFVTMLELYPDTWSTQLDNYLIEKTNLGDSARAKLRTSIGFFWSLAQGINVLEPKKTETDSKKTIRKKTTSPKNRRGSNMHQVDTQHFIAEQQITTAMDFENDSNDNFKHALLHKFTLWLASDLDRDPDEIKEKWIALRETLDLL